LGAAFVVLALLGQLAPAGTHNWRLSTEPRDAAEAAVRDAAHDANSGLALAKISQQLASTPAGGLARLAAGLEWLDAGRPAEALAELTHPDIDKTLLRDHALLAASRAAEALGRLPEAAAAAIAAADEPGSGVACAALPKAAALFDRAGQADRALMAFQRTAASCPADAPAALLELGNRHLARGERAAAAAAFDRLDREYPLASEARQARARLAGLAGALPARTAAERSRLLLERGSALLAAGRTSEALDALRAVQIASLTPDEADLARVRLGRVLVGRGRRTEGRALLLKVGAGSPHAAEAAYRLAADAARRSRTAEAYVPVADRFPATAWGEEALLSLANHYQKDALDDGAAPWWGRLLAEYPDGRYAERAAWRAGWGDYRAKRFEQAATTFEATARRRPPGTATAGLLYWSGRSRQALGQDERARELFRETIARYKNAYHGARAQDTLARMGGALPAPVAPLAPAADLPAPELLLPEPRASRARQLLLIGRLDEAAIELRLLPPAPRVMATLAWIDWQRGRLRPAITAMKRAYPEWVGEAGDRLPREVWQVLFPIRFDQELVAAARGEGLDPALVAALILQESSYDPGALSRAGARGLMQVMPATGRTIARAKGVRFKRAALNDPVTSIDFGTHYLRQMSERYAGAVEKVLAAYNAGPHRVDAWTLARGEQAAEDFIETIPFTETRNYVMIVLANREQYRRLYGLARTAPAPVVAGPKP
jgi:soluble lytic murein transglycosylase